MHSLVDPDRLVRSIVDNILSIMPRMDVRDDSGENPHDPPGIEVNPNPDQSLYEDEDDAANPDPSIKFAAAMIVTRSYSTGQIFILTEKHPLSSTKWTLPMHGYDNTTGPLSKTLYQEIIPRVLDKLPVETRYGPDENLSTRVGAYPVFSILDQCIFFCDFRRLSFADKDLMEIGDQFKWLTFPNLVMGLGHGDDFDISPLLNMLHRPFALMSNNQTAKKNIRDIRSGLSGHSALDESIDNGMPLTDTTTMWDELQGAIIEMKKQPRV
jgi:hypothetical protein